MFRIQILLQILLSSYCFSYLKVGTQVNHVVRRFHPTRINRVGLVLENAPTGSLESTSFIQDDDELDTGDIKNMKFKCIIKNGSINKYRLEGRISSKELNSYLDEYKAEMKQRKVVFPGFRAGKLPPYVMVDVRRYIVSYGLELNIGQLCNLNELIACTEEGGEVPFGEDAFYEKIFVPNEKGFDFQKQRDDWKEGTDFSFVVEFWAKKNEDASVDDSGNSDRQVVDTTAE